jgi:hypothetical protein
VPGAEFATVFVDGELFAIEFALFKECAYVSRQTTS